LHPLTALELGSKFDLTETLSFGGLPALSQMTSPIEKHEFLKSYVGTYIQEEIKAEQIVRQLNPFRRFLSVAAQMNSKIINYSAIHRDVGADVKTIQNYYQILEDTMMGFFLEPFHSSVRKVLSQKPKFYFFDLGVQRAIAGLLEQKPAEGSGYFGELFETFFILECFRLNDYLRKDFRFYFLRTKDDVEIDLIVKRPGKPLGLIEIKSAKEVREDHLRHFRRLGKDFKNAECFCACRERLPRKVDNVLVAPWQDVLKDLFEL
jgi:predicted AAA+ superfamily ATPase